LTAAGTVVPAGQLFQVVDAWDSWSCSAQQQQQQQCSWYEEGVELDMMLAHQQQQHQVMVAG
jgi:hypothetical protein